MRIKYLIAATLFVTVVSYAVVNNKQSAETANVPTFVHHEQTINVNTADIHALQQLKGIGRQRAKAIVAYRQAHGNFATIDDLSNVKGISRQTIRKLDGKLAVG